MQLPIPKSPGRRALSILCLIAVGGALGGCDIHEDADVDNGEQLFAEKCASCHTLAHAGSEGRIGPDLDAAFSRSRKDGMDQDTIEAVVERMIAFPQGNEMPANLVEGEDLEDVAHYVAKYAGKPGAKPANPAAGDPGGQVFLSQGCGSCHVLSAANSEGAVGPNLDETLEGKDSAYIEKQIVDPNSQVVSGFQAGQMPENYEEVIQPDQLQALVEFILRSVREAGS